MAEGKNSAPVLREWCQADVILGTVLAEAATPEHLAPSRPRHGGAGAAVVAVAAPRADVITDSANVKVTLGKDEFLARVVGVDQDKDIAVLQVLVSAQAWRARSRGAELGRPQARCTAGAANGCARAKRLAVRGAPYTTTWQVPEAPPLSDGAAGPTTVSSTGPSVAPRGATPALGGTPAPALKPTPAVVGAKKGAGKEAAASAALPKVTPLCVEPDVEDLQVGQKVYAIGELRRHEWEDT